MEEKNVKNIPKFEICLGSKHNSSSIKVTYNYSDEHILDIQITKDKANEILKKNIFSLNYENPETLLNVFDKLETPLNEFRSLKSLKNHGISLKYHNNGTLVESSNFSYGIKEGPWKTYFSDTGTIKQDVSMEYNVPNGTSTYYYKNGNIRRKFSSKNGLFEGKYEEYFDDGQPRLICFYTKDMLDGNYLKYRADGSLFMSGNYRRNSKNGIFITKVEQTGELGGGKIECNYLMDSPHGSCISKYSSGNVRRVCNYSRGNLHGEFKVFFNSKNPILKQRVFYSRGGVISGNSEKYDEKGNLLSFLAVKNDAFLRFINVKVEGQTGNHIVCDYRNNQPGIEQEKSKGVLGIVRQYLDKVVNEGENGIEWWRDDLVEGEFNLSIDKRGQFSDFQTEKMKMNFCHNSEACGLRFSSSNGLGQTKELVLNFDEEGKFKKLTY